jgi:hypothetical protein
MPVCGERDDVPHHVRVHVWADGAAIGDPCQCGAQRLPRSARPFLVALEPGDYIEADEQRAP